MQARNIFKLFDKTELNITHLFWHLQSCTPVTCLHISQELYKTIHLLTILFRHQILFWCDQSIIIVRFHFKYVVLSLSALLKVSVEIKGNETT